MRSTLVKICWPILRFFESDQVPANYKKSHRVVLIVLGSLFLFLSLVSFASGYVGGEVGAIIPIAIFAGVGLVAIIVGTLGSDGAVAKIWGTG